MRGRWTTLAVVAGTATLVAVAGCGSSGSSSSGATGSAAPASGASNEKATLSYGIWDKNQAPAMQKIADAYTKTHPNTRIDVQVTPYTDYFTKLQTAATGGQAPDVFWMNGPNLQLYASNGVLSPLTTKADTSAYPAALADLYSYKGKQYGLPKDFDTIGLWYNKQLFDAAGVKYPDSTWTWQTFQDAARKLTDVGKGRYGAVSLLEGQEGYYNTIFQAGGYVVSDDGTKSGYGTPEAATGLQFWTDLIKSGVSPSQQQMTDTAPYQLFEAGKVAMFWGGSWDAVEFESNPNTKANADVAVLPQGKERATVIHGLANVVSARTKHAAQAQDFAAFLGSKEAAEIEASTGTVIPAYDGTQQGWVSAHPQFHLQNFLDELAYAKPLPVSGNTAAWNTLETDTLTKAWSGQQPTAQAANELGAQMTAALGKEKK